MQPSTGSSQASVVHAPPVTIITITSQRAMVASVVRAGAILGEADAHDHRGLSGPPERRGWTVVWGQGVQ